MVPRNGRGFEKVSEGVCFDDFQDFVEGGSVLRLVTPAPAHQLIELEGLGVVLCSSVSV